jgi:hypothetical protein
MLQRLGEAWIEGVRDACPPVAAVGEPTEIAGDMDGARVRDAGAPAHGEVAPARDGVEVPASQAIAGAVDPVPGKLLSVAAVEVGTIEVEGRAFAVAAAALRAGVERQ